MLRNPIDYSDSLCKGTLCRNAALGCTKSSGPRVVSTSHVQAVRAQSGRPGRRSHPVRLGWGDTVVQNADAEIEIEADDADIHPAQAACERSCDEAALAKRAERRPPRCPPEWTSRCWRERPQRQSRPVEDGSLPRIAQRVVGFLNLEKPLLRVAALGKVWMIPARKLAVRGFDGIGICRRSDSKNRVIVLHDHPH